MAPAGLHFILEAKTASLGWQRTKAKISHQKFFAHHISSTDYRMEWKNQQLDYVIGILKHHRTSLQYVQLKQMGRQSLAQIVPT